MRKILLFALARHDDVHTSATFELAKELKSSNEVLIVEHPYTWSELLKGLGQKRGLVRLFASFSFKPVIKRVHGIWVLIPPSLIPTNFLRFGTLYRCLQERNHRVIAKRVNSWLVDNHWESYYFVNSYNYHFTYLKYLVGHQERRVYHCVDPIIKPYTRKHGLRNQEIAVSNSDVVISTAPQLQKGWESKKPSFLVANGVNYRHFNSAQKYDLRVRNVGEKVIGYFGAIERRIDFTMLVDTFKANPDWTLVLAGPVEEQYVPAEVFAMPNVHLLGRYSYQELPALMYSVDVTIIPFKMEVASRSIYPLKLYEYMSTGKPIVCTCFNEDLLIPLSDMIHLADTTETLPEAIESALADKNIGLQFRRKAFASRNTWERRAKKFLNYLTEEENVESEASY